MRNGGTPHSAKLNLNPHVCGSSVCVAPLDASDAFARLGSESVAWITRTRTGIVEHNTVTKDLKALGIHVEDNTEHTE